jgi:uncharacterized protein (DUF362 family)
MEENKYSRREFIRRSTGVIAGLALVSPLLHLSCTEKQTPFNEGTTEITAIVSIVRIREGKVERAVEEAIDWLGGIHSVTEGKQRIILKPNLVADWAPITTKRPVIKALAKMMRSAGKEVCIGEGSAAAAGYNHFNGEDFRTWKPEILDPMQEHIFDTLGYTELAEELNVPLINLHSGEMVTVPLPDGFAFKELTIHRSLAETDMLCSVPMMKTHSLAQVTLGMKNIMGVYPGTVYGSVRAHVHDIAAEVETSGTAVAVVDMVRANRLGLTVIDGTTAMEGQGPSEGELLDMNVVVAGMNPLATDMVGAYLMGFEPHEVPTFTWANGIGMQPASLKEIEVRGEHPSKVRRRFKRPRVVPWNAIRNIWGYKEISGRGMRTRNRYVRVQ